MYHNDIPDLESISDRRYENIFPVNQTTNSGYHFYNIIKSIRFNPDDLDPSLYFKFNVNRRAPYTALSYSLYGSINMWWLICVINNIDNPITFIEPGTIIKVIKKQYVSTVIDNIKNQL